MAESLSGAAVTLHENATVSGAVWEELERLYNGEVLVEGGGYIVEWVVEYGFRGRQSFCELMIVPTHVDETRGSGKWAMNQSRLATEVRQYGYRPS